MEYNFNLLNDKMLLLYPIIVLYVSLFLILFERVILKYWSKLASKFEEDETMGFKVDTNNIWKRVARDMCLIAINADFLAIILINSMRLYGNGITTPLILAFAHLYLYIFIIILNARQTIRPRSLNSPQYTVMYLILGLTAIITNAFTIQFLIFR